MPTCGKSLGAGCCVGGGGWRWWHSLRLSPSSCPPAAWPVRPAARSAQRFCCPAAPAGSAGFCERLPAPAGCSPDAAPDQSAGPPASGFSPPSPDRNDTQRFLKTHIFSFIFVIWDSTENPCLV